MTGFEHWVIDATRNLARQSAIQVRTEIEEHFQLAREAALDNGASPPEADQFALNALGDPKTANCQYRQVLLTAAEAKMLRSGNSEAHALCARPWLKRLILAAPVAAITIAIALFFAGRITIARDLFIVGIAISPLFAALVLPIRTPARGRLFRRVKWLVMAGAIVLLFGQEALHSSWLLISCLWPLVWTEWTRASIRRKLPVAAWPRQLYL